MPRGDRTGPWGMGPMTGRRAGYCAGYSVPGYANPAPGAGLGLGYGFGYGGRGWRHRFYATGLPGWARYDAPWGVPPYAPSPTREQELEWLKSHVEALQSELEGANKRISELEQK
jgi:hypothetical protein